MPTSPRTEQRTWPDFESMPLDELRNWPARRMCEAHPKVAGVRGEKSTEHKGLTIRVTFEPGVSEAERGPIFSALHAVLRRWIWDGWHVAVCHELVWKEGEIRKARAREAEALKRQA